MGEMASRNWYLDGKTWLYCACRERREVIVKGGGGGNISSSLPLAAA